MADRIEKDIIDLLLIPSTATLTSVMHQLGITNVFMHRVEPLCSGMKMAGPAFTLRYIPARQDLGTSVIDNLRDVQRIGIEEIGQGQVLVIDAREDTRAGTMGSILATRIYQRGAAGVVTDGAFRDSPVIAEIGIPAYAVAMNANTNKTIHHPSEIQVPIACGGVAVVPNDIVVGDGEGVVVVPASMSEKVAEMAVAMEEKEDFLIEKIRAGSSILGVYPPDEKIIEEYEEWKIKKVNQELVK
ncbi:MAG: ribonuclease activity regulator RraA [Candidatus Poribacteria bacterium]|nr:ribonuclease activity regulator RraA [Candidatus Poribacteria bacterium]|tara:strand:+ start:118 stop:846 length:729 start_codon:yes stop_codon:yes gene_type:complete